MKRIFTCCALLFILYSLGAHEDRIIREVMVQVSESNFNSDYIQKLFPKDKVRITSTNLYAYTVEFATEIPFVYLEELRNKGFIEGFWRNRKLQTRVTSPNDTLFALQTHHLNTINLGKTVPYGIRSIDAWDNRKNITTLRGDTIVIAIIDEGFDLSHIDLDYFINYKENPADTLDNDSNGARNDYRGWNADRDNEEINSNSSIHGIPVSGIAAAKGNNTTGVAGVAWNAKILPVNGIIDGGISAAIRAYDYCINMKKLYLQTNGKKGAYIVAINFSIGTEGSSPAMEPLWCAVYEKLGEVGILATCAVTNSNGDVLTIGDMPTLCNKPAMINSTAMNASTFGVNGNGYSSTYVHLATPTSIYTTKPGNSFGSSGVGTSFTAPQVAGAIALMYSNFSVEFLDSVAKNPSKSILKIKNALLNNVDKVAELNGKVVSGGKLNLYVPVQLAKKLEDSLRVKIDSLPKKDTIPKKDSIPKTSIVSSGENLVLSYSADKNIYILNPKLIPLSYSLYNMLGQSVYSIQSSDKNFQIDCHHLPSGIYFLSYYSDHVLNSVKLDLR